MSSSCKDCDIAWLQLKQASLENEDLKLRCKVLAKEKQSAIDDLNRERERATLAARKLFVGTKREAIKTRELERQVKDLTEQLDCNNRALVRQAADLAAKENPLGASPSSHEADGLQKQLHLLQKRVKEVEQDLLVEQEHGLIRAKAASKALSLLEEERMLGEQRIVELICTFFQLESLVGKTQTETGAAIINYFMGLKFSNSSSPVVEDSQETHGNLMVV